MKIINLAIIVGELKFAPLSSHLHKIIFDIRPESLRAEKIEEI